MTLVVILIAATVLFGPAVVGRLASRKFCRDQLAVPPRPDQHEARARMSLSAVTGLVLVSVADLVTALGFFDTRWFLESAWIVLAMMIGSVSLGFLLYAERACRPSCGALRGVSSRRGCVGRTSLSRSTSLRRRRRSGS
jgi:hypothetical protein